MPERWRGYMWAQCDREPVREKGANRGVLHRQNWVWQMCLIRPRHDWTKANDTPTQGLTGTHPSHPPKQIRWWGPTLLIQPPTTLCLPLLSHAPSLPPCPSFPIGIRNHFHFLLINYLIHPSPPWSFPSLLH